MASWSDVKAAWSSGWKALDAEARRVYGAAIQAEPSKYAARVGAFLTALTEARANLDGMRAKLPNPPRTDEERALVARHAGLEKRYQEIAAGFYADASATERIAAAPVLVVGGLAAGLAASAWAVAAYEYAVNLREQTALADRELTARIEASRQGRTLPPSTLPPQRKGLGLGALLVGGLVLTAGAVAVPAFFKR